MHLGRDVAEVADDSVAPVGEGNAVQAPLVILHDPAIGAILGTLRRDVRLARFERVPEDRRDLVGVRSFPENVNDLVEIASHDAARNVAEHGERDGIYLADLEIGVDEIDAQRCLIEQRLELRRALLERGAGFPALLGEAQLSFDAREQLALAERFDEVVVGAGLNSFDSTLFSRPGGQEYHRHRGRLRVIPQRPKQPESIQPRHHHVAEDEIRRTCRRRGEGRSAIRHGVHHVAAAQQPPYVPPHVGIVVHPQNPGARGGRGCGW